MGNLYGSSDSDKIPISALSTDADLSADSDGIVPSQKAVATYVNGRMRKTYINGSLKTGLLDWTDSVTASGGQAVFYITSDRTSAGTAMATELFPDSIQVNYIDSSGVYSTGTPVIAASKKSITVPITKQSFSGVTVLGINVLGTASNISIPDGVTVKMQVIGNAV